MSGLARLAGRAVRRGGVVVAAVAAALAFGACSGAVSPGAAAPTTVGAGRSAAGGHRRRPPTTAHRRVAPTAPGSTRTAVRASGAPAGRTTTRAGGCRRGDPLADVYHPYRLQVRARCLTVTGTVTYVRHEDDGDVHISLALPASEEHLLDGANRSDEHGDLVTEIVPADQPGCTPGRPPPLPATAYRSASYDYGRCTGADVRTPPLGSRVSVTGPYVLDADHGWMEVHPVWAVRILSAPPSTSPPATSVPTTTASGAPTGGAPHCAASAAPSSDGYAGDYQVTIRSNQPDTRATASDSGDTWSEDTNSAGSADIRLYHTAPGMAITVTVGSASCSTPA